MKDCLKHMIGSIDNHGCKHGEELGFWRYGYEGFVAVQQDVRTDKLRAHQVLSRLDVLESLVREACRTHTGELIAIACDLCTHQDERVRTRAAGIALRHFRIAHDPSMGKFWVNAVVSRERLLECLRIAIDLGVTEQTRLAILEYFQHAQ